MDEIRDLDNPMPRLISCFCGLNCCASWLSRAANSHPSSPAAGAPVEIDISKIGPGEMQTFEWRGAQTPRLTDPAWKAA